MENNATSAAATAIKSNANVNAVCSNCAPTRRMYRSLLAFKVRKDGPYEFVLDVIDNEVVIIGILDGGIIERCGGFKIGDQIVSVNGTYLNGHHFLNAINWLEELMEDDEIKELDFQIYRKTFIADNGKAHYLNFEDDVLLDENDYDLVTSL